MNKCFGFYCPNCGFPLELEDRRSKLIMCRASAEGEIEEVEMELTRWCPSCNRIYVNKHYEINEAITESALTLVTD